jgi:hypothetical protein
MNPAGASNLNNYALNWTSSHSKYDDIGPFAYLMPGSWPPGMSVSSGSAKLKSARYNPATKSVTLIANQVIKYSPLTTLSITGTTPGGVFATVKTSGRKKAQSNSGPALTDLEGNQIVSHLGASPGYFSYNVSEGLQPKIS